MKLSIRRKNAVKKKTENVGPAFINTEGVEGVSDGGKLLLGYRYVDGVPVRASTWSKYYG